GEVIDSIAYSYIDQAGKKQTAGPWGGNRGLTFTIVLAPSETIKTISGTTVDFMGNTVVTSLTFVTNVTTYGPFGKANVGEEAHGSADSGARRGPRGLAVGPRGCGGVRGLGGGRIDGERPEEFGTVAEQEQRVRERKTWGRRRAREK
ncbi:hypothetical protein BRADI_1g30651v3, partial [Brachypodium distachyon]